MQGAMVMGQQKILTQVGNAVHTINRQSWTCWKLLKRFRP